VAHNTAFSYGMTDDYCYKHIATVALLTTDSEICGVKTVAISLHEAVVIRGKCVKIQKSDIQRCHVKESH